MKYNIFFCLLAVTAMTVTTACGHHDDELAHHHHDHEHGEAPHAGSEISLSPEAAARFGVSSDTIRKGEFHEVIKVTGQIIDNPGSVSVVSAPTSGIVRFAAGIQQGKNVGAGAVIASVSSAGMAGGDRNRTDQAALNAAKRELDRVTPLYDEGIVSQKDYNAAKEAYELALTQYSPVAASGSAKAVNAGVISDLLVSNGQYVEAGTPIATIAANRRLTLRADVPDRYINVVPLVQSALMKLPYSDEVIDLSSLDGARVSNGEASVRLTPGYLPIYFTFNNDGKVVSRTIADVYLIGASRHDVVSVPVEAVVEQQGKHFVFVQLDEDCYEKIPVTIGQSDGQRVEIKSGLSGGEYVVTKGATAVRLAESSAVVPEGHSHSH